MDNVSCEDRVKELEEQLRQAEMKIRKLSVSVRAEELMVRISSDYSNFGLWEYDIAEDIFYEYKRLDGDKSDSHEPVIHFRESTLSRGLVYQDDIPEFNRMCDSLERGDSEIRYDFRYIPDSGEIIWIRNEGKAVYDDNGTAIKIVGRSVDVTAEKGGTGVSSDSRRDPITGLLNAETFRADTIDRMEDVRSSAAAALMLFGIDDFAKIREECGQEYSDYVQTVLGKIISNHSAIEHGSICGRIRNGLFGLLVFFDQLSQIDGLCEKIIGEFNSFIFYNGGRYTVSGGISLSKYTKSYEEAFKQAHFAVRAARADSGVLYCYYRSEMACGDEFVLYTDDDTLLSDDKTPTEETGLLGIYQCLSRALMENKDAAGLLRKTMRLIGKHIGASHVYLYQFRNGELEPFLVWSSDSSAQYSERLPMIKADASDNTELTQLLSRGGEIRLDAHIGKTSGSGFCLANGAVVGVCHAIIVQNRPLGYFCYVSDVHKDWGKSEFRLLENLRDGLSRMYELSLEGNLVNEHGKLAEVVVDTMAVESFTIDTKTFKLDYIGAKAARHYNIKPGEICYKKIYGYDAPCRNCPVHQLKEGRVKASDARYDESTKRWINVIAVEDDDIRAQNRYYIFIYDITSYMGHLQAMDTLTGAMTFDKFTAEASRIMSAYSPDRFLCVVSIANFRGINEERGFEFGNNILIMVADLIAASIASDEMLCRSDGSRFLMIVCNENSDELNRRLEGLLMRIQKQIYERLGIQVYLLVGAYQMSEENVGIMGSIDRAMSALKTVKKRTFYNSNLIALYDDELRSRLMERRYIEAHMLEALDNDEFKVFYQPKVSIKTGKIVGAEALVRWIRPNGEIISPGRFVPLFEENGFISDMDFAIYRHAIADIKRWIRSGYDVPLISLNVSRHHLRDDSFAKKLNSLVDALGVPHEKIELEITESLLAENLNTLVEIMNELKSTGFRISVDDFGSGYSSLNLITLLPFDTLKIDGGFFLKNKLTEKNKTVISSVVKLAKSLNLEIVSEGVETDEQVDFLKELGCDVIQGFYYYRPMPVQEFENIIINRE